jgi:DNA-binding MarR family transcriptional regulator
MSRPVEEESVTPLQLGALLRLALDDVRRRIYAGVVAAGFTDVRPAHVTLFRWPGPEGRRPTELAAWAQLSKQTVNDLLRDLEAHGYLELRPDPTDDRARLVRLTEQGQRLHEAAVAAHARVEAEWAQAVGRQDFERLRQTLSRLVGPSDAILTTRASSDGRPGPTRRQAGKNSRR